VLTHVASTLRTNVRRSDVIARLGGDEFALLLTDVEPDAAKSVCNKLHAALTREMRAHGWAVGFSMGIAAFTEPPSTVGEIVTKADSVMYAAKRDGKNTVRLGA